MAEGERAERRAGGRRGLAQGPHLRHGGSHVPGSALSRWESPSEFLCVRMKHINNPKLKVVFCRMTKECSVLKKPKLPKMFVVSAFEGMKCLSGSLHLFCGDLTKCCFEKEERQRKGECRRGGNVASHVM